ncbi:MAG: tRNA lysidine(34) synthetase TilS [Oscillospiraceae bacterium]|jgi:tRNA(Ile)-lysidine synthase|nr:tRNA lysidine(34) synthetase TilS [Oscillospiraceae bacterium]
MSCSDFPASLAALLPGGCVLAGLSGGADSVALLHWLCAQRQTLGLSVQAVHVHHGLRGAEADADEAHCRVLCAAWSVPLHVRRCDVKAAAQTRRCGLEETGRALRYAFFAELANQIHADRVALAHTLSDRCETFLLHFARGSALRGLCSIPVTRSLEGTGAVLVRPLLDCARGQIEDYCAAHGLCYRQDVSNGDTAFRRNAIRHQVLPPLQSAMPGMEAAARRMFPLLAADEAYMQAQAQALLESEACGEGRWTAAPLAAAHPALRGRTLRLILLAGGCEPAAEQIEAAAQLLYHGGALQLTGRVRLRSHDGLLCLESATSSLPDPWEVPLAPGETLLPDGRILLTEILDGDFTKNLHKIPKEGLANCLSCDIITGNLSVGTRRAGDAMRLCNGAGTKPLKKLFQERGVSAARRSATLLLRDAAGVVWLEGFGCAHHCRLRTDTRRALRLKILPAPLIFPGEPGHSVKDHPAEKGVLH